jgi:hypothetical protein
MLVRSVADGFRAVATLATRGQDVAVSDPNWLEKQTDAQAALTGLWIALFVFWLIVVALIGIGLSESLDSQHARSWTWLIVVVAFAPLFVASFVRRIWSRLRGTLSSRHSKAPANPTEEA